MNGYCLDYSEDFYKRRTVRRCLGDKIGEEGGEKAFVGVFSAAVMLLPDLIVVLLSFVGLI